MQRVRFHRRPRSNCARLGTLRAGDMLGASASVGGRDGIVSGHESHSSGLVAPHRTLRRLELGLVACHVGGDCNSEIRLPYEVLVSAHLQARPAAPRLGRRGGVLANTVNRQRRRLSPFPAKLIPPAAPREEPGLRRSLLVRRLVDEVHNTTVLVAHQNSIPKPP